MNNLHRELAPISDAAWAQIAGNFGDGQTEAARLLLASALLSIATDSTRDVEGLKEAALEAVRRQLWPR